MKQLTLLFLGIIFAFSSCQKNENGQMSTSPGGDYDVFILKHSLSTRQGLIRPVAIEYLYDVSHKADDKIPRLKAQNITGDTIFHIEYSYTPTTITASRTTLKGDVYTDSLRLNGNKMAVEHLYHTGLTAPFYAEYNTSGARTKVKELKLTHDNMKYISCVKDGEVVAEFLYTNTPNFMNVQQYSIPGAPYYWSTNCFGTQSGYLLDKALVKENKVYVTYTYSYEYDARGFATQETILRNGQPFMTNVYQYEDWRADQSGSELESL